MTSPHEQPLDCRPYQSALVMVRLRSLPPGAHKGKVSPARLPTK
jgi:hypothetical protein